MQIGSFNKSKKYTRKIQNFSNGNRDSKIETVSQINESK